MTVPFVGLTGGLAAGKSTALSILEKLGCATLSTDAAVAELYSSGALTGPLVDRFGSDVAPDGVLDKQAVATHAFASDEDRKWLESLIWPLVGARVMEFRMAANENAGVVAAVVETPLLFEAGMHEMYDATIAVIASDELRMQRASERGHEALAEREARQLSQDEKSARATYTVVNDGSFEHLEKRLSEVLQNLMSR